MSVFRANGWSSSNLFAYEYNSYGNNITNAQGLASYVNTVKARTGASKVAIVNHSMGGLVSQYYLKVLGGNTQRQPPRLDRGRQPRHHVRRRLSDLHDLPADVPGLLVHLADLVR
ncbi:esterase/lipase family protein [Streptomyces sp. KL116D]|uniref:esterase/lipase family protein n=1 Tax=Streptomyces sp. KL116D TaxID=3045152 RepID=UPI0035584197